MRVHLVRTAPVLLAVLAMSKRADASGEYFIDEVTIYNGMGCTPGNLNDVTSALHNLLYADGRAGHRYTEGAAWPQDFSEACSTTYGTGGLDSTYADAHRLSVFAGHGLSGGSASMIFGQPRNGRCQADLFSNVRLGNMAGGQAGYAVYAASCVMRWDKIQSHVMKQWLRQQFGFHDSPIIEDYSLYDWYYGTYWISNKQAWIDEMQVQYGWIYNSPIVVSRGLTDAAAWSTHTTEQLRGYSWPGPLGNQPVCTGGQGTYYWYYTFIDNGQDGC